LNHARSLALVHEQILKTVGEPEPLDDEIRDLFASRGG
jgi:hypothetical protein